MSATAVTTGVWRDRTNLFISYRQSYTHHPTTAEHASKRLRYGADGDSERAGLMSNFDNLDDGDAVIEMDVLPPRWLDVQDEVNERLSTISGLMRRLETLHARHVLPGFDDDAEKAAEEREIESVTGEVTRGFGACQRAIKRIDTMLREPGGAAAADATMARNLQIALAGKVGEASTRFRKKQAAYLKKMRALGGLGGGTPDGSGSGGSGGVGGLYSNPYTDPAMQDEATDRYSAQSTLQQTAQVRRRIGVLDSTIATREREIESIAQGVIDLSNIFQELNSMVIDQGSLLDRIDYNVERVVEDVKAADKELTVATSYQKKSTKRKIILLLVLLVVGMFILLLVKPRRSNNATPIPPVDNAPPPPHQADTGRHRSRPRVFQRDAGAAPFGEDAVRQSQVLQQREWKQRRRRQTISDVGLAESLVP